MEMTLEQRKAAEAMADRILQLRQKEVALAEERHDIEVKLANLIGLKDRGSKTENIGNFKVVLEPTSSIKMDWEKMDAMIAEGFPRELVPHSYKREVSEKGVNWLRDNRQDLYTKLPLNIKPGKPSVKITRKEIEQ